jgi:hypothetical protein
MIVEVQKEKNDYNKYILFSVNRALANINQISKKLNSVDSEKSIITVLKSYEKMLTEAIAVLQKIKGELL